MYNIIIACNYYWPINKIGALRPTKISKYLSTKNKVNVITCDYQIEIDKSKNFKSNMDTKMINSIKYIKKSFYYKIIDLKQKSKAREKNKTGKITKRHARDTLYQRLKKGVFETLLILDDKARAKKAVNLIPANTDVIISTYNNCFGHYLGYYAKKKHRHIKWIADFRDLLPLDKTFPVFCIRNNLMKKVLKHADVITTVTPEIAKSFKTSIPKVYIPNGFDRDDIKKEYFTKTFNDKLTISYTGTMYGNQRDFSPLWNAINELISEEKIDKEKIIINYAGPQYDYFKLQIAGSQLGVEVIDHGFIPRDKALKLQFKSDILLLGSWDIEKNRGIVPGKFYDYLNIGRTIMCFISGTGKDTHLKNLIQKTNSGYCYEEGNKTNDYIKLKNDFLNIYNEFLDNGFIKYEPNEEEVNKFEYSLITKKFSDIIDEIV